MSEETGTGENEQGEGRRRGSEQALKGQRDLESYISRWGSRGVMGLRVAHRQHSGHLHRPQRTITPPWVQQVRTLRPPSSLPVESHLHFGGKEKTWVGPDVTLEVVLVLGPGVRPYQEGSFPVKSASGRTR